MKPNTIKAENGAEVYETEIHKYADEYINTVLDDPGSLYGNSSLFTGMLKYIYKNVFKPNKTMPHNCYSNLDTGNIALLDDIWNVYTELCYKYKKRPTILNFCLMVGLDNCTLMSWKDGKYRTETGENGLSHSATVKKWYAECEANLLDGATENNSIGCIFALKANYGYTEQPQRLVIENNNGPAISRDELINNYGSELLEDNKRPDF